MYEIKRSRLFKQQSLQFVLNLKERAGSKTVNKFIDNLEDSIKFISKTPKACVVYTEINGQIFHKWTIKGFPHSIFFRVQENTIILEAIYAHRMDIAKHIYSDICNS